MVFRNDPGPSARRGAACGLLGACPCRVNWHWRGDELSHVITHSSSKAESAHSAFVGEVEAVLPEGVRAIVEVPVREEQAAAYGAMALSGRHRVSTSGSVATNRLPSRSTLRR